MKQNLILIPVVSLSVLMIGCKEKKNTPEEKAAPGKEAHGHQHEGESGGHGHEHDEVSLGTFKAGDMEIEAAQGHGKVEAGKEGHLVIKLPYKDDGATVVRAWIGSEDRTLSSVGKGEYAPSHDDYDVHAVAPSPLPSGAKWWVEIEKPDGSKVTGSVSPKM